MPGLMDFAGLWRIDRVIEDRLGGQGLFDGTARFEPDGDGLRYREEGLLTLGKAPPMHAERGYHWRPGPTGGIEVLFEDGRPFHNFDPAAAPVDRHYCDPDIYDVTYDFTDWPRWSSTWVVSGPRKDYVMRSRFTPADRP